MVYEDDDNPSWPSFLIDLDLAIEEQRDKPFGSAGENRYKSVHGNRSASG